MSSDDSVNNSSLSEITNDIPNIYKNFSFDNINSFSSDDVNINLEKIFKIYIKIKIFNKI
jgi:hypothetical protein